MLERATVDGIDVVFLYRPAGPAEMELVRASGMKRWPPRLPEQPIFYPVTNERQQPVEEPSPKDFGARRVRIAVRPADAMP